MARKSQDAEQTAPTSPQDATSAPDESPQDSKPVAGIKPRTLAAIASKRLGRVVNDKRVRSVARDTIARFQDDAYTAHVYTPSEAASLLSSLATKGRGGPGMTEDEASAAIAALDAS